MRRDAGSLQHGAHGHRCPPPGPHCGFQGSLPTEDLLSARLLVEERWTYPTASLHRYRLQVQMASSLGHSSCVGMLVSATYFLNSRKGASRIREPHESMPVLPSFTASGTCKRLAGHSGHTLHLGTAFPKTCHSNGSDRLC